MNQEVNVLALVKGKERYVFLYTGQNREEIVETFGRYAADPELSFTWYDAAVMTRKALREKRTRRQTPQDGRSVPLQERQDDLQRRGRALILSTS